METSYPKDDVLLNLQTRVPNHRRQKMLSKTADKISTQNMSSPQAQLTL
jgi:hypothetical protein